MPDLSEKIPLYGITGDKAFVALIKRLQGSGWRNSGLRLPGEYGASSISIDSNRRRQVKRE